MTDGEVVTLDEKESKESENSLSQYVDNITEKPANQNAAKDRSISTNSNVNGFKECEIKITTVFGCMFCTRLLCALLIKGRVYKVSVLETAECQKLYDGLIQQNPKRKEAIASSLLLLNRKEIIDKERRILVYDFKAKDSIELLMPIKYFFLTDCRKTYPVTLSKTISQKSLNKKLSNRKLFKEKNGSSSKIA